MKKSMQTITIRVHESVYEKVKALLAMFSKEEVEMVEEKESKIKTYLQAELDEINAGTAHFVSEEEAIRLTDAYIAKHANRL